MAHQRQQAPAGNEPAPAPTGRSLLRKQCAHIIAGHVSEKSSLYDDMIDHVLGLADNAAEVLMLLQVLCQLDDCNWLDQSGTEIDELADAKRRGKQLVTKHR